MAIIGQQWESLVSNGDRGPAALAAIGLLVLDSDIVIEHEIRRFLPGEGVGLYVNRLPMAAKMTPDSLADLAGYLPTGIGNLVPNDRLDVIAFGCTSGTMAIGAQRVGEIIRGARPSVKTTDPISAALKALKQLNSRKIALLTPYDADVNQLLDSYLADLDAPQIIRRGCFNKNSDPTISRISPEDIFNAGVYLASDAAVDALFISCTALRCHSVISRLEQRLGKPVITSNQALAWDALRLAGNNQPMAGHGVLFLN